jgi:hypothetical protein
LILLLAVLLLLLVLLLILVRLLRQQLADLQQILERLFLQRAALGLGRFLFDEFGLQLLGVRGDLLDLALSSA